MLRNKAQPLKSDCNLPSNNNVPLSHQTFTRKYTLCNMWHILVDALIQPDMHIHTMIGKKVI